jgi:antitoxin StbD
MQTLLATQVASISELKKNPTKLINEAHGKPVAILNHNIATAYLISAETFEHMINLLDEHDLQKIVEMRLSAPFTSVKVDFDEL